MLKNIRTLSVDLLVLITVAAVALSTISASKLSASPFPDFDFVLSQGDYWEYQWVDGSPSYEMTYADNGRFRVELGNAKIINGVTGYEVLVSGVPSVGITNFAPRWKYLASVDGQLLGSVDGSNFSIIFDSVTGEWVGGGFFFTFPEDQRTAVREGVMKEVDLLISDLDGISGPALVTGFSRFDSDCYPDGSGAWVCAPEKNSVIAEEYFWEGIGPVGAWYQASTRVEYGGTIFSTFHVGLVASHVGSTSSVLSSAASDGDVQMFSQSFFSRGLWTIYTKGRMNTFGQILSSAEEVIAENDSGGDGDNFRIVVPVTAGTFNVGVTRQGYSAVDSFTLVSKFDPAPVTFVDVEGIVFSDTTPICAMVLANGQYVFSCDGTGAYHLRVPLDDSGRITIFSFADGFAPYRSNGAPHELPHALEMQAATPESPVIEMTYEAKCLDSPAWVAINGEIRSSSGDPLCAMILANGQHMFSCNDSLGRYNLTVPSDLLGLITVFGFADGFKPYRAYYSAALCEGP